MKLAGFVATSSLSSGQPNSPPQRVTLVIGHKYRLDLVLPCVVCVEITIDNTTELLGRKCIQVLRNRAVLQHYPSLVVPGFRSVSRHGLKIKTPFKGYNNYLLVVSNNDVVQGLENFNEVYCELVKDPNFLNALQLLSGELQYSLTRK